MLEYIIAIDVTWARFPADALRLQPANALWLPDATQPRGAQQTEDSESLRVDARDRPIDRSTDRFDSIPHFGPGPQQALM